MSSIQSQGRQTVNAFFDSKADAERAAERIRAEGLSPGDVRVVAGDGEAGGEAPRREHKGFWQALGDFFLPNEDRYAYAEGLSRGGFLLSVAATEANRSRIVDILDDEGTVDFDAREASWRSEGWQGYRADDDADASHSTDPSMAHANRGWDRGNAATAGDRNIAETAFGTASTAAGRPAAAAGAETLSGATPLGTEGQQRFGRRDTSLGGSRVRTYHSDDLGGTVTGGGLADQVDRTDIEMEDRREEGLLDRDEIARREAGRSH